MASLFKSDRCGIETYKLVAWRDLDPDRSNQTVAGLKQCSSIQLASIPSCSNQTVAGLKRARAEGEVSTPRTVQIRPLRDWNPNTTQTSSMSVCVQIRPLRDWNLIIQAPLCRCRYRVQIRPLRDWNQERISSHWLSHTVQIRPLRDWNLNCSSIMYCFISFKSDRCGIETIVAKYRCNVTIWFKSDRCGIETQQ